MRSCSCLVFFESESVHCIIRGTANILFLRLFLLRAGSNLRPTLSRKVINGTRICWHCSRRLLARFGSKCVASNSLRCCSVCERTWRNVSVSWKSDEAPPDSLTALLIWCSSFKAATISPADQPKDISAHAYER